MGWACNTSIKGIIHKPYCTASTAWTCTGFRHCATTLQCHTLAAQLAVFHRSQVRNTNPSVADMEGPRGSGRLVSDRLPPRPSGKLQQGGRSDDPSSTSTSYETGPRGGGRDWSPSTSGAQSAKAALEQLRSLIEDAVFLDEDTFGGMKTLAHYSQKLQNAQKRIKSLGQQLLASQAQLARKDEQIREEREKTKRVERKVEEIQQELDNNQVVFKMHYNEILQRNEEIERLKSVIEGLSSAGLPV